MCVLCLYVERPEFNSNSGSAVCSCFLAPLPDRMQRVWTLRVSLLGELPLAVITPPHLSTSLPSPLEGTQAAAPTLAHTCDHEREEDVHILTQLHRVFCLIP